MERIHESEEATAGGQRLEDQGTMRLGQPEQQREGGDLRNGNKGSLMVISGHPWQSASVSRVRVATCAMVIRGHQGASIVIPGNQPLSAGWGVYLRL